MGAIGGAVSCRNIDLQNFQRVMLDSLSFRYGNHHSDSYLANGVLLVSCGWSANNFALTEHHECVLAMEGEIYNSDELCRRFFPEEKKLCQQKTLSVISLLYEKFGIDFPKYLNGVFAIAICDKRNKMLHLCRDHVGSHSLYYSRTPDGVFFSSTINSLLATGLVSTDLSQPAVNQYFASKALSPPATMYKAVSAVRAAHVVTIKGGNVTEHDYWNLHQIDVDEQKSEDDYIEQLRHTIFDAITIRANYSAAYGAIVSGGLDSGIVAATLARRQKTGNLHAFSVSFNEGIYSDDPLQKLMVKEFSLRHHQAILGPMEFAEMLNDSVCYLDSPVNDIAFVGMAKVFDLAKQKGVEVVFEGEGPDEIFPAGNTHGERQMMPFLLIPDLIRHGILGKIFHTMPLGDSFYHKVARLLARIGMNDDERRLTWRTYFHNALRKQLLTGDWYTMQDPYIYQRGYLVQCENRDPINCYQYGLIKTFLPDNLLFKDERMAASKGVINRVPFIDYRLVELALKIPSKMQLSKPDKYKDGIKLLYKKVLKGHIPEAVINHKKVRGFSHPTAQWFRNELKDFVMDILLGSTTRQRGIVNPKYIEKLINQHLAGRANLDFPLNSLLVFELWMRNNYDSISVGHV